MMMKWHNKPCKTFLSDMVKETEYSSKVTEIKFNRPLAIVEKKIMKTQ